MEVEIQNTQHKMQKKNNGKHIDRLKPKHILSYVISFV